METQRLTNLSALASLALAAFCCGPVAAITASIHPAWVEGHHAFTLAVSGTMEGVCAPLFSHSESRFTGGKLVLSTLAQSNPAALCAKDEASAYRTEFTVAGMDTGTFPVQIVWMQACQFQPNPCPVAYNPQDIGNIRVTDSAHISYVFTPAKARAGTAFKLHLNGTFNCADGISAVSADSQRPAIYLNFTVEPKPEILCIKPFGGIDFEIPGLTAGTYQVFAARNPYCAPGTACPAIKIAPQLAGALDVEGTTALAPMRPKASGALHAKPGDAGFRTGWHGAYRNAAGRLEPAGAASAGR